VIAVGLETVLEPVYSMWQQRYAGRWVRAEKRAGRVL